MTFVKWFPIRVDHVTAGGNGEAGESARAMWAMRIGTSAGYAAPAGEPST